MKKESKFNVMVHYLAAEGPFKDSADLDELLSSFKQRVLSAFGLAEEQTPDGDIITYELHYKKANLDNPNQTIGGLLAAVASSILQLKLVQQFTQGDK